MAQNDARCPCTTSGFVRSSISIKFRQSEIVAKAVPVAPIWVCDGERGSGPEGADDLCLVRFEPQGCDLSIGAEIQASIIRFELGGWNFSLEPKG